MKTIWNSQEQAELKNRLDNLQQNAIQKWGKMNAAQMLKHIDIAYKNAIDEIKVSKNPLSSIVSLGPVKKLLIFGMPFMKNLPTAKEYIPKDNEDFQTNKIEFLNTFQKITHTSVPKDFVSHPIFGKLSYEEWGVLLYKHLDHHLQQFGV
ncbi:MAG: DUF1569 domain-containing protein [Chitinophagales bacterium]|nr:DUF1569 domain-containing protein [Chitinophagales bacterium]MCZ2394880.1 DUF1569 domain-containing protein [Chitinophagales bacterium]